MKKWIILLTLLFVFPCLADSPIKAVIARRAGGGGGADVTAPEFSSATINADAAEITLSEDVVITGLDDGDFVMTGSTTGAQDLESCSENAGVISCTAAYEFVNGETVTLSYGGGADEVEDIAGNDLASFSGESVTNNTPAGGDYYYASTYDASSYVNSWDDAPNNFRVGDQWTPGSELTVTKMGVRFGSANAAETCVAVLWTVSGGSGTRRACEEITPTLNSWVDVDLTTPYVIGATDTIAVTVVCNGTANWPYAAASGGYGESGAGGIDVENECTTNTYTYGDEYRYGVRFYAE